MPDSGGPPPVVVSAAGLLTVFGVALLLGLSLTVAGVAVVGSVAAGLTAVVFGWLEFELVVFESGAPSSCQPSQS